MLKAAAGTLLAMLLALQVLLSVGEVMLPGEVVYGEAMIYSQAQRIVHGEALYQPLDRSPYTVVAYTPVFYWLVAGLSALGGSGFAAGRIAAWACTLIAAGLVAALTHRCSSSTRASVFAALLFLALGLPGVDDFPWTALLKEDSLALALGLGSLLVLTRRNVLLAALLAAAAVLTKQTFIVLIVAEAIWLWRRQRAALGGYAALSAALVVGVGVWQEWTSGAFVANVVLANVNPFDADWLRSNLQVLLLLQTAPLVIAALHVTRTRRTLSQAEELVAVAWLVSLPLLLALAKVGAASNHWMLLAALTAPLVAIALWRGASKLGAPLVCAQLLVAFPVQAVTGVEGLQLARARLAEAPQLAELVDRTNGAASAVIAEPADVLALSNRPVLFEPAIYTIFFNQQRWDGQDLVDRICGGEVDLIIVDHPLERSYWPAPIVAALRSSTTLEGQAAGRFIYVRQRPC